MSLYSLSSPLIIESHELNPQEVLALCFFLILFFWQFHNTDIVHSKYHHIQPSFISLLSSLSPQNFIHTFIAFCFVCDSLSLTTDLQVCYYSREHGELISRCTTEDIVCSSPRIHQYLSLARNCLATWTLPWSVINWPSTVQVPCC